MTGLEEFLGDLGKKVTGTDEYSKSVTDMNRAQAEWLSQQASQSMLQRDAEKSSNTFLYATVAASLITVGVITYFVIKKKK